MQKFRDSMENLYERAREGLSTEELKALSGLTELAGGSATHHLHERMAKHGEVKP